MNCTYCSFFLKAMKTIYLFLFFLLSNSAFSWGQKPIGVEFVAIGGDTTAWQQSPKFAPAPDSAAAAAQVGEMLDFWLRRGHCFASIDSVVRQKKDSAEVWRAYIWLGAAYDWGELRAGNVQKEWLEASGFRPNLFRNSDFSAAQLDKLYENLLRYCENNGYPFARLRLDSLALTPENTITAALYIDKGERFVYGNIVLEKVELTLGSERKDVTARIKKGYLTHYLGIRKGAAYSERNIQKMQTRINALPFLQTERQPYIVFIDQNAEPHFFLRARRASRFDFLVGVQPNSDPLQPQLRRVTLTGNVLIDLQNAFGRGERLMFAWQRFRVETSQLKVKAVLPYLFDLPLGADMSFELYRRDSTYIDIIGDIGAQYLLEGGNYLKLYWKNTTTNVTSIDTARIRQTRQLPSVLDLRLNWVGVEYYMQQLDYRFNPRKGIELRANISAGRKRIRPNIAVLNLTNNVFDFSTLYDSLTTASVQLRWQGDVSYFIPLARRATLQTRLQTALLWSSSPLFQNELFRIGGNRTQRGFDEEQIFASAYATFTLEARYLLTTNSYFFGFADASAVDARSQQLQSRTFPYSFGIGLALDTKIGIFGLSYAIGTYAGDPIQVRNAKIHFGYVNMF